MAANDEAAFVGPEIKRINLLVEGTKVFGWVAQRERAESITLARVISIVALRKSGFSYHFQAVAQQLLLL